MGPSSSARGNARLVRDINERAVLAELRRRGTACKSEIAEALGLSTNAVGLIAAALQSRGLVTTTAKRTGFRGQPATPLCLDATGAHAIGIHIGRSRLQAVLLDFAGKVLASRTREMPLPTPEAAVALIAEHVGAFRASLPAGQRARLIGIGIAVPSNLDSWRRELGIPEDVAEAWSRCELPTDLAAALEAPIMLVNDGTALAAAERYVGVGRQLQDFALVHLGTALGGGLVLKGAVRLGRRDNAGDFGLMPVAPSRLACTPKPPAGLPDILLNRASYHALERHFAAEGLESDADTIAARPDLVETWVADCAAALTRPLYAISTLLDPQAIVLSGRLPDAVMDALLARLSDDLAAAAPESRRPPKLVRGMGGTDAGATGATFRAVTKGP
ncbi:MAG: ROK family transcriptional regulator, partial [Beijerinckiaceae bacterium]|nr:ROK family transcriptional regulator [Beijerinckiaceae bacterium]